MSSASPPTPSSSSSSLSASSVQDYLNARVSDGLLFSGWYTERVRVEEAQGKYLDRLTLDRSETEAAKVIKAASRKAKKVSTEGFTGVESECFMIISL